MKLTKIALNKIILEVLKEEEPKAQQPPTPGETEPKKLKIDIPDNPFNPDASQITSRLKQILIQWEDKVYPNDRVRWNDYYHDIETLVKQIEKSKEAK